MTTETKELERRIGTREATVCVVGQGYVGLPMALAIAEAGYRVSGLDVDPARIAKLAAGKSYIPDVPDAHLAAALASGKYSPSSSTTALATADIIVICVPTPLRKSKDPDVSYILAAMDALTPHLRPGVLVILESTTYPGTTDELIAARITGTGLVVGRDVHVCFSPERIDPGSAKYNAKNIPKVIGGTTPASTRIGASFYGSVVDTVVPVSSARVAEMVKLLENTFRAVNIGLVNELALMCERMDIDIWEAIDAAATKPFGYMAFQPGPGIGGHCIPLDPMYLAWKARMHDFYNKFIELASDVNGNMPRHVVAKVGEALNLDRKSLRGAHILVLGIAYKKDVDDYRESPSLEVLHLLDAAGAKVDYHDPHVPVARDAGREHRSVHLDGLARYDCVVLATNHTSFDYARIARDAKLIVDTRNAFNGYDAPHLVRLGTPTPSPETWDKVRVTR